MHRVAVRESGTRQDGHARNGDGVDALHQVRVQTPSEQRCRPARDACHGQQCHATIRYVMFLITLLSLLRFNEIASKKQTSMNMINFLGYENIDSNFFSSKLRQVK